MRHTVCLLLALLVVATAGCSSGPETAVAAWFDHANSNVGNALKNERQRLIAELIDKRMMLRDEELKTKPDERNRVLQRTLEIERLLEELREINPDSLTLSYDVTRVERISPEGTEDQVADVFTRVRGTTLKREQTGRLVPIELPDDIAEWVFVCRRNPKDGTWFLVIPPTMPDLLRSARDQQQAEFLVEHQRRELQRELAARVAALEPGWGMRYYRRLNEWARLAIDTAVRRVLARLQAARDAEANGVDRLGPGSRDAGQ